MKNGYIWAINGCEFELDMEDADTAERYLSALRVFEEAETADFGDIPSKIRFYCTTCRKFYDVLFGDGSSEKIFSGIPENARKYDEIFASLLDFVAGQRNSAVDRMESLANRYAPKRTKKC